MPTDEEGVDEISEFPFLLWGYKETIPCVERLFVHTCIWNEFGTVHENTYLKQVVDDPESEREEKEKLLNGSQQKKAIIVPTVSSLPGTLLFSTPEDEVVIRQHV